MQDQKAQDHWVQAVITGPVFRFFFYLYSLKIPGLKYGIIESTCCGCDSVKCLDCPEPTPKESLCPTNKPAKCYTYKSHAVNNAENGCFEATCLENESDAPNDKVRTCQRNILMAMKRKTKLCESKTVIVDSAHMLPCKKGVKRIWVSQSTPSEEMEQLFLLGAYSRF